MHLRLVGGKYRSFSKAFTLVEVIVCTAIIAVVFVSLYAGISSGFSVVNSARENLRATQIMVEKMETIRLYTWDQINSNGFIPTNFTAPFFPGGITTIAAADDYSTSGSLSTSDSPSLDKSGGLIYFGTLSIGDAPVSTQYATNMKLVTLTLTWKSGKVERKREMQTLIAKHGLQKYIY